MLRLNTKSGPHANFTVILKICTFLPTFRIQHSCRLFYGTHQPYQDGPISQSLSTESSAQNKIQLPSHTSTENTQRIRAELLVAPPERIPKACPFSWQGMGFVFNFLSSVPSWIELPAWKRHHVAHRAPFYVSEVPSGQSSTPSKRGKQRLTYLNGWRWLFTFSCFFAPFSLL